MEKMPLCKRFVGSIIDKLVVLTIFVVIFMVIDSDRHSIGKLLYYLIKLMSVSPSSYQYASVLDVSFVYLGFYYPNIETWRIENTYEEIVRVFDLKLTFGFILLNTVYYLLCELKFGASLGKSAMGGLLVNNFDDKISSNDIFIRASAGVLLMTLFVGIRFLFDTNYYWMILLFFLFVDFPVFINNKSMIDKAGRVRYVKRSCYEATLYKQEQN